MGAWGYEAFENDHALDWVGEVVNDDFWSKICWSTTLFFNYLPFLNQPANAEIAYLNIASLIH